MKWRSTGARDEGVLGAVGHRHSVLDGDVAEREHELAAVLIV